MSAERFITQENISVPHVSWEVSQNVSESHFIVDDLVIERGRIKRCKILVRPCVGCNLMTFGSHTLNNSLAFW